MYARDMGSSCTLLISHHVSSRIHLGRQLTGLMMRMQACMQLTKKQGALLLTCRRTILHDVSALIAEWDRQWAELQVSINISALDGLGC